MGLGLGYTENAGQATFCKLPAVYAQSDPRNETRAKNFERDAG